MAKLNMDLSLTLSEIEVKAVNLALRNLCSEDYPTSEMWYAGRNVYSELSWFTNLLEVRDED